MSPSEYLRVIPRTLFPVFAGTIVWGCAPAWSRARCLPEEVRVASRLEGVPQTVWNGRAALIQREPQRHCQVLFEPAFATHHAVWLTVQTSGTSKISVSALVGEVPDFREASLDPSTTRMVKALCHSFLTAPPPTCARWGADGVTYHAAHYVGDTGYAMRSFWSPKRGTVEEKFVRLAEALRDYVVVPEQLRSIYGSRIRDNALELHCALHPDEEGCGSNSR